MGESDNKDAARREKLASMITVGGEGLSASEERVPDSAVCAGG